MDRPRRAAASKPAGHYAATTTSTKRKKSDSTTASSRKKGKQRAEPTVYGVGSRTPVPLPADVSLPIPVITPDPLDPAALASDLNKSYEDQITSPKWPKRQQRWKNPTGNPIRFMEDTPIGWNTDEPDLDPQCVFPIISTSMDTNICYIVIWRLRSQGVMSESVIISCPISSISS